MPDPSRPIKVEDRAYESLFTLYANSRSAAGALSYILFQLALAPVEPGRPATALNPEAWEYVFQHTDDTGGGVWKFRVFYKVGQIGYEEAVYVLSISARRKKGPAPP